MNATQATAMPLGPMVDAAVTAQPGMFPWSVALNPEMPGRIFIRFVPPSGTDAKTGKTVVLNRATGQPLVAALPE